MKTNVAVPYPDWETIVATRGDFDKAVGGAVQRVVETVQGLLTDASLKAGDINTIFVTGGSSMVPILRQSILSLFQTPKSRAVTCSAASASACRSMRAENSPRSVKKEQQYQHLAPEDDGPAIAHDC